MALRANRGKLRLVEAGPAEASAAFRPGSAEAGAPAREDASLPPQPSPFAQAGSQASPGPTLTPTPSAVTPPPIGRATAASGSNEALDTPIPGLDPSATAADRLGSASRTGARASAAT